MDVPICVYTWDITKRQLNKQQNTCTTSLRTAAAHCPSCPLPLCPPSHRQASLPLHSKSSERLSLRQGLVTCGSSPPDQISWEENLCLSIYFSITDKNTSHQVSFNKCFFKIKRKMRQKTSIQTEDALGIRCPPSNLQELATAVLWRANTAKEPVKRIFFPFWKILECIKTPSWNLVSNK